MSASPWWKPFRWHEGCVLPDRWFSYGIRESNRQRGADGEEYFFAFCLPSYEYSYVGYYDGHAWLQKQVLWFGRRGFRMGYRVVGKITPCKLE